MTGQRFTNAEEVMILVRMPDGREHGWVIHNPTVVEWTHAGMNERGSALAHLRVGVGEFYRRSKSPLSRKIEDRLNAALGQRVFEIEPGDDTWPHE